MSECFPILEGSFRSRFRVFWRCLRKSRDSVATGCLDLVIRGQFLSCVLWWSGASYLPNIKAYNSSRALNLCLPHLPKQHLKLRPIPLDYPASAKESHNPRHGTKTAEHNRNSSILVDVRDGFGPRTCGIDIGTGIGREDRECGRGKAFGRDVDMLSSQGC
jgi:hypothetical protein